MDENRLIIEGFTMQELIFQLGDLRRCNDHLTEEIRGYCKIIEEKDRTIELLRNLLSKESD